MSLRLTRDACRYEDSTMKTFILKILMRSLIGCVDGSVPAPFLVVLLFWLTIIFVSFGLFAP